MHHDLVPDLQTVTDVAKVCSHAGEWPGSPRWPKQQNGRNGVLGGSSLGYDIVIV